MKSLDSNDIEFIIGNPLFRQMLPTDRARILGHVRRRDLAAGEKIYEDGESSEYIYLFGRGRALFRDGGRELPVTAHDGLGEELLLGSESLIGNAVATEPSVVYLFPKRRFGEVVKDSPKLRTILFDQLMLRTSGTGQDDHERSVVAAKERVEASEPEVEVTTGGTSIRLFGWILAVLVPAAMIQFGPDLGLATNAIYFLAIVGVTMVMWLFDLVPAFVAPLFSVLAFILFDVASPQVAVAGFASDGFFMLLSIFAVGALMVMSGLTYRISLAVLRIFPGSPFWYSVSLFLPGVILTPILPSQLGRTVIVTPSVADMIEISGAGRNDRMAAQFVASGVLGISLMASIFLTGKPANLIVFGMFDPQTQFAFQWMQWLWAALVVGGVLLLLYFLLMPLFFRNNRKFHVPREVVRSQSQMLGPLSSIEWATIAAIVLLLSGILTTSFHKVDIPWMSMSILLTLLFFGALKKEDLSHRIDWSILIFIGSIIAWVPVMKMTGIEDVIAHTFSGLGDYMKNNLTSFILALCGVIVVARLALPELVLGILLVTILFPIASAEGVSLWLIGFVILTMAESYIFPYQAPHHVQMKNLLGSFGLEGRYNETRVLAFNFAMTLARIVAIYVSIPYWKHLDII
jgi:DASS family divalent anion:Na+ symporter